MNSLKTEEHEEVMKGIVEDIAQARFPDRQATDEEIVTIIEEVRAAFEGNPINTLEEAKKENAHLYMEGDWGGQIYLSIPANLITCDETALKRILAYLDRKAWGCNKGEGCGISYKKGIKEYGINGGMGGGEITDSLWVHDEFEGMKEAILKVMSGKSKLQIRY